MRIERHIFGSTDGYQTLAASPGLSTEECKALQGFAFGTIYDPKVRDSFRKTPGYWSRPVGRRRRAITRIVLGEPDDAGRPTLLFISAVVSADDWDQVLQGDARPLLQCGALWKWDRSQQLAALDGSRMKPSPWRLNGEGLQRVLGLLSLLEQSWSFRKPVVVRERSYTFDEILAVERLLPPVIRRGYSAVYRGLDGQMPVSLNALTQSVHATGANPFRQLSGATSPYAKRLLSGGISDGHIPTALIQGYRHFAKPVVETSDYGSEIDMMSSSSTQPRAGPLPGSKTRGRLVLAASIALSLIVGGALGWIAHRPPPPTPPPNPWRDIAAHAVAIPLAPNNKRQAALYDLLRETDSTETDEPNGASALKHSIELSINVTAAEQLIEDVEPGNNTAFDRAEEAIKPFATQSSELAKRLRDRLDARMRPRQDTLKRAMDELCSVVDSANTDAGNSRDLLQHLRSWTNQASEAKRSVLNGTVAFLDELVSDHESKPPASQEPQTRSVKTNAQDNGRLPPGLYSALGKILELFEHELDVEVFDAPQRDLLVPLLQECAAACDAVNDLGDLKDVLNGMRKKLGQIMFKSSVTEDSTISVTDPNRPKVLQEFIKAADGLIKAADQFRKVREMPDARPEDQSARNEAAKDAATDFRTRKSKASKALNALKMEGLK